MTTLAMLFVALGSNAIAGSDKPVEVAICVEALDGAPVAAAVLRHPREQDRRRVNADTGCWTDVALYLNDGTELTFAKNLELEFEVSAPGFVSQVVKYTVRARNNRFSVALEELVLVTTMDDDVDDIDIQFYRSRRLE